MPSGQRCDESLSDEGKCAEFRTRKRFEGLMGRTVWLLAGKLAERSRKRVNSPPKRALASGNGITKMLRRQETELTQRRRNVSTKDLKASERGGSKKIDRATSKMNGRDCGALRWSVDAVKIGSRVDGQSRNQRARDERKVLKERVTGRLQLPE